MLHTFRDDAARRITVTVTGTATFAQVARFLSTTRSQDAWNYAMLYDFRAATINVTNADLQLLADHVDTLNQSQPRGPVAVVGTDPSVVDVRAAYAAIVGPKGVDVELFGSLPDALKWLDGRSSV